MRENVTALQEKLITYFPGSIQWQSGTLTQNLSRDVINSCNYVTNNTQNLLCNVVLHPGYTKNGGKLYPSIGGRHSLKSLDVFTEFLRSAFPVIP